MKSKCGGIALLTLLVLIASLMGADPAGLTPEAGVLQLRNGHLIEGQVTQAGDYYVVTLGESGELRIPVADVESTATSIQALYENNCKALDGRLNGYVQLADWCLRQKQPAWATQQWIAASKLDPNHPQVKSLERRLSVLAEQPAAPSVAKTTAKPTINAEEMEASLHRLSPTAMERYATVIQPMILNRCATNGCHGTTSTTPLAYYRAAPGQPLVKRFTDRNLYNTLRYLDFQKPGDSPLLIMAQRRHGEMITTTFDKRDKRSFDQLNDLKLWVLLATNPPRTTPSTIPTAGKVAANTMRTMDGSTPEENESAEVSAEESGTVEQASAEEEVEPSAEEGPPGIPHFPKAKQADFNTKVGTIPGDRESPSAAEVLRSARKNKPAPPKQTFAPRDPFDPEIFNRRYHGEDRVQR